MGFCRSFWAVKGEHQRLKAGVAPERTLIIPVEKTGTVMCEKDDALKLQLQELTKRGEKGPPVRLHRAHQTLPGQEPQCQTRVMTFRFSGRRPGMLSQQLESQRRRQTLLQHSALKSLNWIK